MSGIMYLSIHMYVCEFIQYKFCSFHICVKYQKIVKSNDKHKDLIHFAIIKFYAYMHILCNLSKAIQIKWGLKCSACHD